MYESIIEIDLHGRNTYQGRVSIDAALRRSGPATCRIRVIHGCNSGTALRDFIRDEYARHPKVRRIVQGANPGITELILREY
ncbi:MAG: Smr/MutS family protein [Clostridia bacterium]|nr:Smr/MutS family protein [Clostridia bacterium]